MRNNLTGKVFGRLTVISFFDVHSSRNARWKCLCDCGQERVVFGLALRCGDTRSCGCCLKESRYVHGLYGSSIYRTWNGMLQRCTNPKSTGWKNYGGRGITVCKRWHKFENFLKDMGNRPPGLTLERKHNNEGYCAANCKWATRSEQRKNRREKKYWSV